MLTRSKLRSIGEVSAGEEEDREWRGHSVCHDKLGVRKLRRGSQDLLVEVPRGEYSAPPLSPSICLRLFLNSETDCDKTQTARSDNQPRPESSSGPPPSHYAAGADAISSNLPPNYGLDGNAPNLGTAQFNLPTAPVTNGTGQNQSMY